MLCTRCNKNVAVIFVTRMEGGKTVNEGLCMPCARELGINTMQQMAGGLDMGDMENLEAQMMEMLETEEGDDGEGNPLANFFSNMFGAFPPVSSENGAISNENPDKKEKGKSKDKPDKKKKLLDTYGTNLTAKAKNGQVDMVVGRDREIERLVQILNRRTKNNPALLGEPGVGKTAIAEGFAERIVSGNVPEKLLDKEVYLLDFTAIVAGTQYRGQFEARLKGIIEETKKLGNVILVIDELHNIVGAGDAEGAMSAANILKPALARGEIQVIGATTLTEYRKFIEKDSALERRFQTVIVEEPSPEETVEVLRGIKGYYEDYHKVKIPDEVINTAVNLSRRYITDRYLPDKAIDLIDEAGSRANLKNAILTQLARTEKKLSALLEQIEEENAPKEGENAEQDYEKIAELKTQECALKEEAENLRKQLSDVSLTSDDIAYVVESWTKIPVQKITQAETERLLSLEERLHKRIIGQNEAVSAVSRAIRRNRAALSKKLRPASFIFVGPTGVGKTELVKQLAIELFDSEDALIRVDMTEFMEKHSVSKLIGSPPGYVGYDDAGQLTEKVRRKPYCVVLFDEIEKAHPDVLNIMLQILDDGRVTDSHGKVVSFENTVIVMTSNAGSDWKGSGIGFAESISKQNKEKVTRALKAIFRPEFLNRVDEIVVFDELNHTEMKEILDILLCELSEMLVNKGIKLTVADEVKEILVDEAVREHLGARPLRRLIGRKIEDKLSDIIISGSYKNEVNITEKDGEIVCE
ncbi:MAG: ATP-dependent Clp protease ATP-binding subunit [Ruminococcaceae bacterium]|nr:ATP-dependent Clp protease ATP-binding subunit [Oscillospiraceae bacterium]